LDAGDGRKGWLVTGAIGMLNRLKFHDFTPLPSVSKRPWKFPISACLGFGMPQGCEYVAESGKKRPCRANRLGLAISVRKIFGYIRRGMNSFCVYEGRDAGAPTAPVVRQNATDLPRSL
jgi:hypothetical protein